MSLNEIENLKREVAELRKTVDFLVKNNKIDGNGRISLNNKVLTVDRTVNISDLINRIKALEDRPAP